MAAEDKLRTRLEKLIEDGEVVSIGSGNRDDCADGAHVSQCKGWLAAADNALSLVCPIPDTAYRRAAERILTHHEGGGARFSRRVGEFNEILKRLLQDIDDGLLTSVANQASAETFDDLLDHAERYLNEGRKEGSGILSTAVFEDTIRRIGRSHGTEDDQIDTVISELAKQGVITGIDAKACRFAAGVRNAALHARWENFELPQVKRTIEITRELLREHLAR